MIGRKEYKYQLNFTIMKLSSNQRFVLYFAILILLFVIFLTACKKSGVVSPNLGPGKNLVLSTTEQQKATADNSFTLKLFKNLDSANTTGANLFASPLSVSFALGMTSNGANGATLTAFKNTLGFGSLSQTDVNTYYNNLITNLPKLDPNTTLNIANSIWYRQTFSVQPQFLQTNSDYFHAKISALDFNSVTSSLNTINGWVNTQTNGKIPKILNQIASADMMFLVNAIYFKSMWKEKFDPSNSKTLPFHLSDGSQVNTMFMDGKIDYNTYSNNTVNVVELPYSNSKYSMVIAMPAVGTTTSQLAKVLDSAKWQTWMNGLSPAANELRIPKFTFSYGIDLKSALTSLGLGIAFSDVADFSGISAGGGLNISSVQHKAFIAVDESGTTAAAVTSVGITATDVLNVPPMTIDRPFIFAIREMSSGIILFVGTVNNPLLTGE
jgi:serpin B